MDLYLIDGNSYVYRAFYAIKGLTNSKGFPTNAIYGFTNMLIKIIREKKPDGVVVSFDSPGATDRHKIYNGYKAHRPEMPSALVQQLPYIRQMISAFNIRTFEMPGYEADDIIGTISKKAASEGANVFIVTADKDMLQLVDGKIKIYDPMKDRILDSEYVIERFGVGPERVTEFMALMGDAVDNIPGVKGIGEKTARELLTSCGSLSELLEHPEIVKKEKLRSLLTQHKDVALLSQKLAAIDTSAPIDASVRDFALKEPDWLSLLSLFKEFEFSTLMKLIPSIKSTDRKYEVIASEERLANIATSIRDEIAFDLESTGRNIRANELVGIALSLDKDLSCYVPVGHEGPGEQIQKKNVLRALRPAFLNSGIRKIGHNLKKDLALLSDEGIGPAGDLLDTMIAAYLINPNRANHNLDEISLEYLGLRKSSLIEVMGKKKSFAELAIGDAAAYASENAAVALELKGILFDKLKENGLEDIYYRIEMPLIRVLAEMEWSGIKIDTGLLQNFSREMGCEMESLEKRIHFMAGEEFNINSPKQLSKVLFLSLGLNPVRKTKTGFSTDIDVLEELAVLHDLPREVINYRSLSKLKTTYIDVLPGLVNPATGRVHTSFNQTAAATGRLSSSDPNLQNIPIRGDWGKRIRQAFIAEQGNLLLSADYSQVELRILAHLSGDAALLEAFEEGLDIHARTASELNGLAPEEVTAEMRRTAKMVNFGIIYGISPYGLSEGLGIERDLAKKYIERYFERHPGVKSYIDKTLSDAREKGYATTLFGRKRPIPELKSTNKTTRQLGERLAINSPVQGGAADIIKLAMINIHARLQRECPDVKMILQVHDELLFELPSAEREAVANIVREEMECAGNLSIPLKVDMGMGPNWAEAH